MALMHVDFFAKTLGMAMSMDVILPEGEQGIGVNARPVWDGQEELPVLYLLHGTSDDHTIWQRRTSIERYAAGKKLAVVMPASAPIPIRNSASAFSISSLTKPRRSVRNILRSAPTGRRISSAACPWADTVP